MRHTWRRQGSGAGALWHWHGREWLLEEGARALAMVKRPSEATFRLLPCSTCGFHDGLCSIAVRRCHNTGTFRGDAFARSGRGARCCEAETRRAPTNSCRSLPCTLAITAIEPECIPFSANQPSHPIDRLESTIERTRVETHHKPRALGVSEGGHQPARSPQQGPIFSGVRYTPRIQKFAHTSSTAFSRQPLQRQEHSTLPSVRPFPLRRVSLPRARRVAGICDDWRRVHVAHSSLQSARPIPRLLGHQPLRLCCDR
jgi:hypothetical protein